MWLDILTGKQLLFAEPIIKKLERKNKVLCTTRDYRELNSLVKIRKISTHIIGMHGGGENISKLLCSAKRIQKLSKVVYEFQPDVAVSFQSPEAARVAFGLGIRHIGFADSSHAQAVMKLTIPYLDKLLIPWIMKKDKFSRYGISEKDILKYKAIDAALISKRKFSKKIMLKKGPKTIILRMAEDQASYNKFANDDIIPIISNIQQHLPEFRIIILARYTQQIKFLKKQFDKSIKIFQKTPDGKDILRYADVFIGSGGTMTAEAAFLGIPTISYSRRKDYEVDAFLEKKKIIIREHDPVKITQLVKKLAVDNLQYSRRAQKLLKTMEDPFPILQNVMRV
ncbi:MAG: DUF354 domain-containing protein [Thaumarchaeota archaeon]|nr:DUF354 domain-containing protein [Nitrososphaerota archaeon]